MVNENNEEKKMMLRHMKKKKAEDCGDMAARDAESVRGRQVCYCAHSTISCVSARVEPTTCRPFSPFAQSPQQTNLLTSLRVTPDNFHAYVTDVQGSLKARRTL
jgi:hypothetical protein